MTTITELSKELEIIKRKLEIFKKLKINHKIMEDTYRHTLYSRAPQGETLHSLVAYPLQPHQQRGGKELRPHQNQLHQKAPGFP